ncbi:MAG: hypothetical protein HDR86_03675 [Bacteroides sp.]|nr:hypothetical protein [Bacteroides sp.]
MKFKRLLLSLVGIASAFGSAFAAPAFIQHRQDCFKAVPASEEQIIFLGNSITNFHCWADAFVRPEGLAQDVALISNRGISDERAYHWKYNVQMMLDGEKKPAKFFIGIGTNDLNVGLPPEVVVNDIRAIIRQIQISAPETEINLQSILPRGGTINDVVMQTVPMLEEMAADMGVNFINLTETMNSLGAFGNWTVDNLHPNGVGYRAWCQHIAPNVGLECAYVDGANNYAGFSSVAGVHTSQYRLMPVNEDDILIIGDPWVDAVQWHEFLGNANIKNRSIGAGNLSFANVKTLIDQTLKANDQQKCPRAIVLCWGAIRSGNSLNAQGIQADYESLVAYAKAAAPDAEIIVCQTPAVSNDNHTANLEINKVTTATVVDLESKGMTVETKGEWNMSGGIGGRGALYAAQAVGEALNAVLGEGTAKIPSTEDFEARYANRNRRIEVAKCFNAIYQHKFEANKDLSEAVAQIEEILKGNIVTEAQVAEARAIRDNALDGLTFTPDPEKWYHISSPRGYETASASVHTLSHTDSNPYFFDNKLVATTTVSGSCLWSFRQRPDGTYDILSYDGYYLVPGRSIIATRAYPTEGWTIEGGSAETGTYIISSGGVYMHRDGNDNLIDYWMKGDTGCDFYLTEYIGELPDQEHLLSDGWYTITIESGFNVKANNLTGKNVLNHLSGVNRGNGVYELVYSDPDTDHPARALFHLTVNDNKTWAIHGLSGHSYKSDGVALRHTDSANELPNTRMDETTFTLAHWIPFKEGQEFLVGKSGENHCVYEILPASVEDYDIWTVQILATEPDRANKDLNNLYKDTHVTLNLPEGQNLGISTVYNGGYFFLAPGTEFTADDLTVECPNLANQDQDYADISIDTPSKTIIIDFTAGLPTGWYTLDVYSYEGNNNSLKNWTNAATNNGQVSLTTTENLHRQSDANYYVLAYEDEQAGKPARHFIHLASTGNNVFSYRTLHGLYVSGVSTASREPVNIPTTPHPTADDVYRNSLCIWQHNLANVPHTYLTGKFGSENTYYTIKPAEIDNYDIYDVRMINHYTGTLIPDDATLTLDDEENQGIPTVRNNGTFFVTKGTDISAKKLTASTLEGMMEPRISVEPGIITVDYTPIAVESIEISESALTLHTGATAQLSAEVKPDDAFNKQVFWASSDEEVATVSEEGLISALKAGEATITVSQGEISAECQLTVVATEISITPESLDLKIGDEVTLTATVNHATEGAAIVWSSANDEVATVDQEGKVTAIAEGQTSVTATCDDAQAECVVIVAAEDIVAISEIKAAAQRGELFDLQGRKVVNPEKGVYILSDGTTVILK